MRLLLRVFAFCIAIAFSLQLRASETVTIEPDGSTYNFVSHYSVKINADIRTVWRHLIDLSSWMYEFEMAPVSGTQGQEGQVLRLYSGQDFLLQITKAIPNELLVIANLPSTFKGEYSTGVGVITLQENTGYTVVNLTMSRRYIATNKGRVTLLDTRNSSEFKENARAMWQDRFLNKLRILTETE